MKLTGIVAIDQTNAIGLNGKLPWQNTEELKHFAYTTRQSAIIVGHTTFERLPTLKGRLLLVLSSSPPKPSANDKNSAWVKPDEFTKLIGNNELEKYVLELASQLDLQINTNRIFVAGGLKTYQFFSPYLQAWFVSKLYASHEADTYFDPQLLEGFNLTDLAYFETFQREYYEPI